MGPTSFGDSPYQSFSAFAGNPYYIDLEYLIEEGLLLIPFLPRTVFEMKFHRHIKTVIINPVAVILQKCLEFLSWQEWDEDIRLRRREAVEKYRKLLAEDIEFWKFCQFKFREQWNRLRAYVNQLGMKFAAIDQ